MGKAKILMLLVVCVYSPGCAVKPINVTETYQHLQITLSKKDDQQYVLIDQRGNLIDSTNGKDEQLVFALDKKHYPMNQCFKVVNKKGSTLGNLNPIRLTLLPIYQNMNQELNSISSKVRTFQQRRVASRRGYNHVSNEIKSNRAYRNGSCVLPKQRYLPPRPSTKCQNEYQCKEEGGAICYSMTFGATGCSIAADKLNISGILTSPACGAMAADLAKQKYGLGDAIGDAIIGGIEGEAKRSWDNDNFWDALVYGAIAIGGKYLQAESCTTDFVSKHYGPLKSWKREKAYIEQEPYETRAACHSFASAIKKHRNEIKTINTQLEKLEEEKRSLSQKLIDLKQAQQPVNFCKK